MPCEERNKPKCLIHTCLFYIDNGDLFYRLVIHEATTPFEIGANFKPDENSVLIAAVPDTKTGINQTLTVPNPDFVRSHRKYRDRYVVIVIINKC
jgi:hypothetical protein